MSKIFFVCQCKNKIITTYITTKNIECTKCGQRYLIVDLGDGYYEIRKINDR